MKCSKCGQENDAGAEVCSKCKAPLGLQPNLGVFNSLDVRTSVLGVLACLLGVLSLVVMTVSFTTDPARYLPILAIVSVAVAALAILCGIISLVCIEMSYGRLTGKAFAIIGIVAPLIPAVVFSILVVLSRPKEPAFRMVCGTNLSSLGKAMLIYSNDYADVLPRAAGPNSAWTGRTPNWVADNRAEAYGLDKGEGEASITASLYLLTKYAEVAPKTFLCSRGEEEATEFIPREYGVRDRELFELWDFGPDPARHCSYAYHMPYGQYALTVAGEPGMAVLADRNPFQDSPFHRAKRLQDFGLGDRTSIKSGNAYAHGGEGQNVLFLDCHVNFEKSPCCGLSGDNIYTVADGNNIKIGKAPVIGSQPASRRDSLLVTDGKGAAAGISR